MNDDCISDLAIDRYLAGELSVQRRGELEEHALACSRCDARLTDLRESAASMAETLPPLPGVERRPMGWPVLLAVAAGLLLAVTLGLLWLSSQSDAVDTSEAVATTRTKGRAHLTTYLRRDERVRVFDGQQVRAGDELAFAYSSGVDTHLAIFDLDGGRVTPIFPNDQRTFSAEAGAGVELDFAVMLDDSPTQESIVAIFCDAPQSMPTLRETLASRTDLPAGCESSVTDLPKVGR